MSGQWVTLFDVEKCTGCCNCVLATLDEHVGNDHAGYSVAMPLHGTKLVEIDYSEQGAFPAVDIAYSLSACQHCDEPACAKVAPEAVVKRPDGIVLIDPAKARGRRDLVAACPFGSIAWNEDAQVPQIWTMDAHLLDQGWAGSRASQACPTGALQTQRMTSAARDALIRSGEAEPLRPNLSHRPNVLYRNLDRIRRKFIAGTVVDNRGGMRDCVAGAEVRLVAANGGILAESRTDAFGDFRLPRKGGGENSAGCRVIVTCSDGRSVCVELVADGGAYLGPLELSDDEAKGQL